MKKMNKKGFSMVELLGVIVLLGIIMLVAVPAVTQFLGKGKTTYYESTLSNIESATIDYFIDHSDEIPTISTNKIMKLNTLVEKEYIAAIKDPDTKQECNLNESYIKVTNNGYDKEKENLKQGANMKLKFDVCLVCGEKTYGTCK